MSDSPAFVAGLKSSITDLFVSKYKVRSYLILEYLDSSF